MNLDNIDIHDNNLHIEFVNRYPLGTLISTADQETPFIIRIPFIPIKDDRDELILVSHAAKTSIASLTDSITQNVTCIFDGGHSYISPNWYISQPAVPTWNYASLYMYGSIELIKDRNKKLNSLIDSIAHFDKHLDITDEKLAYFDNLLDYIEVFLIRVSNSNMKVKVSQHRSIEDQRAIVKNIESSLTDDGTGYINMVTWLANRPANK